MVANELTLAASTDMRVVFQGFGKGDWDRVLANWPAIETTLKNREEPEGFSLNWGPADAMIAFAKSQGMGVRMQSLLTGGDIPDEIYNNRDGYSADDIEKLVEFAIKTRALHYPEITNWMVSSEASSDLLFGDNRKKFWYTQSASQEAIIDKAFYWVQEANPAAKKGFDEDHVLEVDTDARRQVAAKYLSFLKHFKDANVPVDIAAIENNLWVMAPPAKEQVVSFLKELVALGYEVMSGETTVSVSDVDAFFPQRSPTIHVTDKLQAQADLYKMIAEAYLSVGGTFGTGGFSDAVSWLEETFPGQGTDAMILDRTYQPKLAYHSLVSVYQALG